MKTSFLMYLFLLIGLCFSCNKRLTKEDFKENIHYFKLAKVSLVAHRKELKKLKATLKNTIVLSDSLVSIYYIKDSSYQNVMNLWQKKLIAKGNSIFLNDDGSMLFVLPNKNGFVIYDPFGAYSGTCGITNNLKFILEKDWYYLIPCPE